MSGEISRPEKKQRSESPPRRAMRVADEKSIFQKMREERQEEEGEAKAEEKKEVKMEEDKKTEEEAKSKPEPEPEKPKKREDEEQPMEVAPPSSEPSEPPEPPVLHLLNEENHAVLYHLGDGPASSFSFRASDVSDDFFELSVAEVKKLYKEKVSETKRLEQGEQLTTRAFKEAQAEAGKLR